jgi:predicted kinase
MERAEHRAFGHGDASDAGAAIAAARAARFMPWPEAHSLDTSKPPAEVARAALAVLGAF